ncbi:MAG: gp58-like family protein [Oscillospiraceae bacterium]|nr:gp58-like family protein [Oscillospiraceae bacterium]
MPSGIMSADTGFPQFTGQETTEQKLDTVMSYLYMLLEELRYVLRNLDSSNFNSTGLSELSEAISSPLYQFITETTDSISLRVEDAEGNIADLTLTAQSIISRVEDAEGNISTLTQTATTIESRLSDAEGNISTLTQTATTIESRLSDAEGNISTLTQTATTIESRLTDAEGNISTITQTASDIEIRVSDAEGNINTITQSLEGVVYESSLANGTTTINGGCITTGTVNAEYIKLGGEMTVYEEVDSDTAGGYIGFLHGSTGKVTTDGIGVIDATGENYVIATNEGARIQSDTANLYVSGNLIGIEGTATVDGALRLSGASVIEVPQIQFGSVKITPSAADTPTCVVVTFDNAFSSAPKVVATPYTTLPGTTVLGVGVAEPSTTGVTIYLTRDDTTETTVYWVAVQLP